MATAVVDLSAAAKAGHDMRPLKEVNKLTLKMFIMKNRACVEARSGADTIITITSSVVVAAGEVVEDADEEVTTGKRPARSRRTTLS